MHAVILVFLGAGFGGVLRRGVNIAAAPALGADFPYGAAIIDVSGSLIVGLLIGWLTFRVGEGWTRHVGLFVATGALSILGLSAGVALIRSLS
jgi:CrcB protein